MGKRRNKPGSRCPEWFNAVRFDEPSNWATLKIPDNDDKHVVVAGLQQIRASAPWCDLLALQRGMLQRMRERDWNEVPSWELVEMLQRVGDIRLGIENGFPSPYDALSFEIKRELHLALFLWHALEVLHHSPAEDFGVAELAHRPFRERALIPARRPLWYELARPIILQTVRDRLASQPTGGAGPLALLCENEARATAVWLPLLGTTPEAVTKHLTEALHGAWDWSANNGAAHPRMSDMLISLDTLREGRSAAELLARDISGELGLQLQRALADEPATMRRIEARQKLKGETSLRHVEHKDGSVELTLIEDLPSGERSPLDILIEKRTPPPVQRAIREEIDALLQGPGLTFDERRFLAVWRMNPKQSDNVLAKRLTCSKSTVRRLKRSMFARLQGLCALE
jgi:hypothetical protein